MSTQEQPSTFIDYYAIAEDFGKRRRAAEASTLSSNTHELVASCGTEAETIARQKVAFADDMKALFERHEDLLSSVALRPGATRALGEGLQTSLRVFVLSLPQMRDKTADDL